MKWQAKEELKEERWKCAQERGSKAPVLNEALSLIDSIKSHCLFSHRAWGRGADLCFKHHMAAEASDAQGQSGERRQQQCQGEMRHERSRAGVGRNGDRYS